MISDVYVARHYSLQSSSSISRSLRMWVDFNFCSCADKIHERNKTIFCYLQRVKIDVARFVLDSIMLLLTKPGPENIKCVCQTLKVSKESRGKLKIQIQWKCIQDYSKHNSLFSIIPHRAACGLWITNGASHWRWRRNKPAEDYRWGAEHSDKATYRLGSRNVLQQLGQKRSWVRFGIVVYELIIEWFLCVLFTRSGRESNPIDIGTSRPFAVAVELQWERCLLWTRWADCEFEIKFENSISRLLMMNKFSQISEEESSFLNDNLPSSYPINIDEIIEWVWLTF